MGSAPPRHAPPGAKSPSKEALDALAALVGEENALRPGRDDLTRYTVENRGMILGKTPLVLRPANVGEVSQIVTFANENAVALVPQGGHTGHAGGGVPQPAGNEIVVSLERMNRLRDLDLEGNTITVEAGMVLQTLQEIAKAHDRFFPLSLGSEGSCMIGGNISTNAGGTGVLAHGNMRDLVLGLEVVLPNGEIWDGLKRLKKDNTGYHLKQLFIGAEGTLGIVTAAVLKLLPRPVAREVALFGVSTPQVALEIFQAASRICGPSLTAFELIPAIGIDYVFRHNQTMRDPFSRRHCWNLLIEVSSTRCEEDARGLIGEVFAACDRQGLVDDAVIGESESQRAALWAIREALPPAQKPEGPSLKHDVSVPVHAIPQLIERGLKIIEEICPGARPVPFGHMGDGNIHFNVSIPPDMSEAEFARHTPALHNGMHALVVELGGSVSAEHGIGLLKRDLLKSVKSPTELAMMRAIKQAFDPKNIMNPGRIFEADQEAGGHE